MTIENIDLLCIITRAFYTEYYYSHKLNATQKHILNEREIYFKRKPKYILKKGVKNESIPV